MSEELKPCPFCNGAASLALCGFGTARVTCMDCGSEGQYSPSREAAMAAWNRRPPTIPASVGRRAMEALEGVLRVADRKTDEFDAARAAITELQQALAAPSGGQRE